MRLLFLLLITHLVSSAELPEDSWLQLITAGQQLQLHGSYAEAELSFQSATDLAPTPVAKARSMNYLGLVKQIRGDYPAAEALYGDAMRICEQHPAPLDMAAILLNQARLYRIESKFEAAGALCRKALFTTSRG